MKPSPRWKIRRRLVLLSVALGTGMIVSGAFGLFQGQFTGELVYGGVSLISATLGLYTTFSTFDDKWQGVKPEDDEENPDG